MKLKHVTIRNFKGVQEVIFPTPESAHALRNLTALLGDNGSGKTTVLQAIALTLSLATRRTYDVNKFSWHGFVPERVSSLGKTFVELVIEFHPEEIELTQLLFEAWEKNLPTERRQLMQIVPPSTYSEVTLRWEGGRPTSPQGFAAVNQFLGRYYINSLAQVRPELKKHFVQLGDIFWFDQYRNLGTISSETYSEEEENVQEGWQAGVEQLREYLVGWWGFHTSPRRQGKDFIPALEASFARIFPGTKFVGLGSRGSSSSPRANDFYFLIERDGRVFDLAETSSGEQAIFPLIYEFIRLDISRSIVLIDELELHLHPPEQQRLLTSLPKIGPDCQFIITTHSEFLSHAIPNEQEVRLKGGLRCL